MQEDYSMKKERNIHVLLEKLKNITQKEKYDNYLIQ